MEFQKKISIGYVAESLCISHCLYYLCQRHGTARLSRNSCSSLQFPAYSTSRWSSVSMPSAITGTLRLSHSA